MSTPELFVSVHPAHFNKTPEDRFGIVESSAAWTQRTLTPVELRDWIRLGRSWVGCHLSGGRSEANAGPSNTITLDIDGDLPLEEFLQLGFAKRCALFVYTTPSHRKATEKNPEAKDRYRAVFWHEGEITDPLVHAALHDQVLERLGLSLTDNSGRKAERHWFGNSEARIDVLGGEPLPWDALELAIDAAAATKERNERQAAASTPTTDDDIARADYLLRNVLAPSQHNDSQLGYESYWQRVFHAAASAGTCLYDAFMDWSSSGDHHKQEARRLQKTNRFAAAGRNSGIGVIFSLAKQQRGDEWWKLLPDHLQQQGPEPSVRVFSASRPLEVEGSRGAGPWGAGAGVGVGVGAGAGVPSGAPAIFFETPDTQSTDPEVPLATSVFSARPTEEEAKRTEEQAKQRVSIKEVRKLLDALYQLEANHLWTLDCEPVQVSNGDAADGSLYLRGKLLEHAAFSRTPDRINAELLRIFANDIGLGSSSSLRLQSKSLEEYLTGISAEPLIPGLMAERGCYLLYGKAATGKTTMVLTLARAIVGDPGHRQFLDFEVPPSAWGNRRVLIVASDGEDEAAGDLQRYAEWHGMTKAQWQRQYLRVIAAEETTDTCSWRMDLPSLKRLTDILDEAADEGKPFNLVVFDSLKSICPDGVRVGDQVMKDYIYLLRNLCRKRGAAQLFIHHQAKDTDNAQGISALEEITSGNFQLRKNDAGQHIFVIRKTRLAILKRSEIPYSFNKGRIETEDSESDDGRSDLLGFLQRHEENWIQAMRLDGRSTVGYPGVSLSQLPQQLKKEGRTSFEQSNTAWQNLARILIKEGILMRIGNKSTSGIRIVGGTSGYTTGQASDLF